MAAATPARRDGRWLAVVGIGEDGVAGLGAAARAAVERAEIVYGGARHLALADPLIRGARRPWPSPLAGAVDEIAALSGRPVCVLASGDPFHFGVGATLARAIPATAMQVFPAPSSFSLAAARLGWPLQEAETISLHGRPAALLRALLSPGARILALTSDGSAPREIAALLCSDGFGPSTLHVLEALGGAEETIATVTAETLGERRFNPLNLVAIEAQAAGEARLLPLGTGLDDAFFEHDGQITRAEVRAVTLAALAPRRGERLWDIGAGAGSVAIEWLRQHTSLNAAAVEADPARAVHIGRNAGRFGVPHLHVVTGRAPAALAGLPRPDAIFVGGGGTTPGVMEAALGALEAGGRLVANAVTLEMRSRLYALHADRGGDLVEVAVARAAPLGRMRAMRPALPVLQWRWRRP